MALGKVRALHPDFFSDDDLAEVSYDGPMPATSAGYYALGGQDGYGYVYVLSDARGSVVYIGRSRCPGNRFDKHRRKTWWPEVTHLTLLRLRGDDRNETAALTDAVETHAIARLGPRHNIAKVVSN